MNCEQGDIAIIKATGIPGEAPFVNRLVEVKTGGGIDCDYGALWLVLPLGWTPPKWAVESTLDGLFAFPDCYLRPIRDPGEDAVDEMLRIAGHPLSESHRVMTPKPQVEHAR